jgi:hypothetical protein
MLSLLIFFPLIGALAVRKAEAAKWGSLFLNKDLLMAGI